MRLIELRLKNLNSLKGEWHIDFSDAAFLNEGIFAITGQTGAGKTTILDAICLALYSQTPRLGDITGSANEMMTQGTGECSAEVIIEINTKRYQCSWYQHRAHKKAKGNLLPIKHEISDVETGNILEEKKSKTSAFIQNLIGMDFNQFTRSIMLAQGSFAAFLKSDIGDRAAILEKITGTAIYAKISSRVHEKKRFEEEVLGKLQAGVNGLSLLSIEDENLLSVELKDLNEQQDTQRQAFKTLNEQLQWLDNVHQLQQNLSLYQSELTTAQHAQQVFIPESMRLELAHKALEIDSQFRELSYSRDTVNKLGVEQQQLVSQISMQKKDLEQASIQRASANQKELQASNNLQINLPIIAKTRQLDINIEQQSQSLADDNQRKGILLSNTSKLRQDIETHNQTKQKTKNQLANIASYFSDFPELSDLDGDMAAFDSSCKRFRVLLEDNVSLANSQLDYDHQSKQLNVDFETFHAEQKTDSERVQKQQEQLIDLKQQQACLIQNHSTATMRSKQEQIDHISTQIEQAGFKLERLSELTCQIQGIHQSLPELHKALKTLEVLIASHTLEIQETKRKKQDKQDHLSLLQRVAKLEDYILELEDGVPCPLCGAHEHPFAKNHPLLDKNTNDNAHQDKLSKTQRTQKQIAELETGIESLNQALSNHNIDFATQKEAIKHQQQQLAPLQQQSKTLYADIQNTLSSLLDAEKPVSESILAIIEPLAQINSDLNTTEPNIDRSLSLLNRAKQNLLEQKQSLKTTLSHYDELNDRISKLSSAMESNEKRRQVLMSGINRLTTEMKLNAQKIESVVDKMAANFSELIPIMATISSLVDKYPVVKHQNYLITELSVTDIQSALEQLRSSVYEQKVLNSIDYDRHIDKLRAQRHVLKQLKQHHNEQISQQQQLANTLSSLTAQIDAKQSQLTHDESALNELETLIADKTSAIEQSISDRKEVFADKDPNNEENKLRDAADNAKAEAALAQRQSDRAKQTLDQLQARQQQLASEWQAVTDTMNNQQSIFMRLLKESQFADETAFINARLSREAREALNRRQQAIENAVRQAKLQLENTQKALAQKLAIPLTQQSRQEIAVQHQQIQTDIDKLNQQIGAIDQKLKDNQRQKGEQAAQLIAIDAQKQKLLVWQQLHTLIGSADGKKYRTFAQGLTFEVMINHANSQLQKMSDRYLLIHDEDNPLELNVIDNYQGGDIRSTKNLSGGEGFIISLALALGLSQMASHNIRVDSLFLDEGFGTLDEESLDIALDTLTSLQQEGKLIGVISHVQALKERILTQIQVKKLSGGFSEISGQGCYKITT